MADIDGAFKILAKENPTPDDLDQLKSLLDDKEVKEAWKDGIPDEFMEKALPKYSDAFELGLLPKDEVQKIANIAKNLKELGAEDALEHFLNDNNSPNGDTVVTYLTQHALAAQVKLDRNEHKPDDKKISPDVVSAIEDGLAEELNTLRTIKDNYTVIDWAKPNKRNFTAASLMETYDRGTDYYNSHNLPAGKTPAEKPSRQLEGIVPAPEDTNVDGLNPQQQGLEKKVADLNPNASEDGDNKHTKSSGKSRSSLKPKDVVDFFYEDVFLAALSWVSDKICNWLENAAKAYAERTKANAQAIKESIKETDSEEVKKAKERLGLEGQNFEHIDADFRGTREERRTYMNQLNQEIEDNIINGAYPQNWTTLDPVGNEADRKILDNITTAYLQDPTGFKAQLDEMKIPAKQDLMLRMQESTYSLGYQMALTEWKLNCLTRENWDFVNGQELKNNPEFQARVLHYTGMMQSGVRTAYLMDMAEGNKKNKRVENFINSAQKMATDADDELTKDIEDGNFAADDKKLKHDGAEKFAKFEKFMEDMQKFAGEVKQTTNDSITGRPMTLQELAREQNDNINNSSLNREHQQVVASMEYVRSKQELADAAKKRIEEAKRRLFGPQNPALKNNSFLKYTGKAYE